MQYNVFDIPISIDSNWRSATSGTKTGTACTEDYLVIPETGKNEGRVCGTKASVKSK